MVLQDGVRTDPSEFSCQVRQAEDLTLVEVAGELDLATAGELRECLAKSVLQSGSDVRIDLTGLRYLDSTGIGVLVATRRRVRGSGRSFSVICDQGPVRWVFEVAGLVEYLGAEPPA
jgi:anti-sigma B factor antagonist